MTSIPYYTYSVSCHPALFVICDTVPIPVSSTHNLFLLPWSRSKMHHFDWIGIYRASNTKHFGYFKRLTVPSYRRVRFSPLHWTAHMEARMYHCKAARTHRGMSPGIHRFVHRKLCSVGHPTCTPPPYACCSHISGSLQICENETYVSALLLASGHFGNVLIQPLAIYKSLIIS